VLVVLLVVMKRQLVLVVRQLLRVILQASMQQLLQVFLVGQEAGVFWLERVVLQRAACEAAHAVGAAALPAERHAAAVAPGGGQHAGQLHAVLLRLCRILLLQHQQTGAAGPR
jgi:hypothetical protein